MSKPTKPFRKSAVQASSEDEDDYGSSSEESVLSSSDESSKRVSKKPSSSVRVSERIRETSSARRKTKYASSSEEASELSTPPKKPPAKSAPRVSPSKVTYSSSEGSFSEQESEPETDVEECREMVVEKIIAKRKVANPKSVHDSFEYLIKWRCRSFLECSWVSGSELSVDLDGDKRSVKLKNFNAKHPWGPRAESVPQFDGSMFYNPIFEVPEKVLAVRTRDGVQSCLVKWTGLSYSESTWEPFQGEFLKEAFERFVDLNNKCAPRLATDSRKSAGRVLDRSADPTAEFATQLAAVGTGPIEYEYTPPNGPTFPDWIFDFQKEGITWLLFNWSQGRGSMLADEMGLGKTVQTSVTLAQMQQHSLLHGGGYLTFLVIAPLSTIEQWKRELRKWTSLEPVVYHGTKRDRNVIQKYEFNGVDVKGSESEVVFKFRSNAASMPKFDVLITTFETVGMEPEFFQQMVFSCIVIDEAHKLKSADGRARTSVLAIPTRHRILLTGTPIQNNVSELWNLLHLCAPHHWGDMESFLSEFGNLKSSELTQRLQARIQPYLLQRRKADVLAHLVPAKEETIVSVELTRLQKETYRAVYEKNFAILGHGKAGPALTNVHMELRKCCNHPFLVQGVEDRVAPAMELLVSCSGKMVFLDKLLGKLFREKSKILIFSQFTMMLDLIEDYLRWKEYLFERLDGGVKTQQRQEAVDRFNKVGGKGSFETSSFVFLLSTKAGGVGLNLTAANYVLLFDHDWNPQNDLQAQARCHRIGQTKEVMIFRLVTRGTYEEKMFQVASQKLGLEQAVMSGNGGSGPGKLTKEEMDRLLKEGAYAMLEDDENEKKFCSEDVEEILETRARTVSAFTGGGGGGGFSKARFQVNETDEHIELNDPNFWAKMASAGSLTVPTKKDQVEEFLDYQMRKGRAQFGQERNVRQRTFRESDSSEGDDLSLEDEEEEGVRGRPPARKDKTAMVRLTRMKAIFRFLLSAGLIENQTLFESRFAKFSGAPIEPSTYIEMLTMVVSLYLLARDSSGGLGMPNLKFDEIHFSPIVRTALACLSRVAAGEASPASSDEPINLDGLMPDLLVPIPRCELNVPKSLVAQPVPKFITDAIPKNRNPRRVIADLDEFNEMRFLIKHPHLMRGDGVNPQADVELLQLCLAHGKDELQRWADELLGKGPGANWALPRVGKLLSRFSQARAIQLTFLVASFGLPASLLSSVLRGSGFPWNRKFACGESCLDLMGIGGTAGRSGDVPSPNADEAGKVSLTSSAVVSTSLTLLTPITPPTTPPILDEPGFFKFLLTQLPSDTPLTALDVADYSKALLLRVVLALGRKSDKHEATVRGQLRVTKNNEICFPNREDEVSVVWPYRTPSRVDAFKLMWRFQANHFIRTGLVPEGAEDVIKSVLIPIVSANGGLDNWELVTNLNRHLSASDLFRALVRHVCESLIQADQVESNIPKRKSPVEIQARASKEPKLTSFFKPAIAPADQAAEEVVMDLTSSSNTPNQDD